MFRPVPDFSEDALIQMVPDGRDGIWALASCTLGSCWRLWHFSNGRWQGPYQPRISGTATSVTDLARPGHHVRMGGRGPHRRLPPAGHDPAAGRLARYGQTHKKAAAASQFRPAARPVAPPNPCPAR